MEEEKEVKQEIGYKIMAGRKYRVWRKDYGGKTFYNIEVTQKNYDGTILKFYRPVTFKRGVDLVNGTDIIIKAGFENLRPNSKDSYNPITAIMITDFETVENKELMERQAYADYQQNLYEMEQEEPDLPF